MAFQYVVEFMQMVWDEIFSIPLPFMNGLTIKGFLIGNLIVCWGIGVYSFFVSSFIKSGDSLRREVKYSRRRKERSSKDD